MPRRVVPILAWPRAISWAWSRAIWAGVMICARELMMRRRGEMSRPMACKALISLTRLTGLMDHAIAEDGDHMAAQDARRDQMQFVNLAFKGDGMPGVVTAGVSGDDIGRLGQPVDDAALAFVAPLRSDYNRDWHSFWP